MKTVIIIGTSRKTGNTRKAVNYLSENASVDLIDLQDYQISYFDYEHNNRSDDFLPLMRKILANYDTLIFASPVYWYSMSAIMKTFFDRISDLLTIEKELGRTFRGKSMGMISCSNDDDRTPGFKEPFVETAGYLGMTYLGDIHTIVDEKEALTEMSKKRILDFVARMNTLDA